MTLFQIPLGNFNGIGPLGNAPGYGISASSTGHVFASVISLTIGIMTVAAGLWFLYQIFIGAIGWLSSGGDKQAVENAKKRLTHATLGLLFVVLSYALIDIVGTVLGLPILDFTTTFILLRP